MDRLLGRDSIKQEWHDASFVKRHPQSPVYRREGALHTVVSFAYPAADTDRYGRALEVETLGIDEFVRVLDFAS